MSLKYNGMRYKKLKSEIYPVNSQVLLMAVLRGKYSKVNRIASQKI